MITIDDILSGGVEFTPDLVRLFWSNHQLLARKRKEVRIEVGWQCYFPEEFSVLFCDRYIFQEKWIKRTKKFAGDALLRQLGGKRFEKWKAQYGFSRPDIRRFKNSFGIDEPYVCFIPSLSERWGLRGATQYPAGGRSVYFEDWLEYKRLCNASGYKVICMGLVKTTGMRKIDYHQLGDIIFCVDKCEYTRYWNQEVKGFPYYLWDQIQIMAGAKFTLGMGGGGLIAPAFGLPCITVDEFYKSHFGIYGLDYEDFDIVSDFECYDVCKSNLSDEESLEKKLDKTREAMAEILPRRLMI